MTSESEDEPVVGRALAGQALVSDRAQGRGPPRFDPSRIANLLWIKALTFVAIAATFSVVIVVMHFIVIGAAWFAFGKDAAPPPWFLLKFFLFIGWSCAAVIGMFASDSDGSPKGGGADAVHDSAGLKGFAQTPPEPSPHLLGGK